MPIQLPQNAFLNGDKKTNSRVGKDVLGFCSRCKMNLMHTIVSVSAENKPDRVLCNTCKTERTYRAPKDESSIHSSRVGGGQKMADRDEDLDLDSLDVTKVLLGDAGTKKKAKAKGKPKKAKDESESKSVSKSSASVPLSMLAASPEDIAQFETRMLSHKNQLNNAKDYKASERFKSGDILSHKTFGTGFVVAESGLNKIEVLFRSGRKLLVTATKA